MLTNTAEMLSRYATEEMIITEQTAVETSAKEWALKHAVQIAQAPVITFLNVQRLMLYQKMIETIKKYPYLPEQERKQIISKLAVSPLEEEELVRKGLITEKQITQQKLVRREQTRIEKRLIEVRERLLSPSAMLLTDHQALCLLEKYLWDNLRTETQQILEQLVKMCEQKAWYIPKIEGLEHLQKLMLETYVTAFMERPYTMNMLALRLTQLTKSALMTKSMSIYIEGAVQAQAMKPKSKICLCEKRKLIQKAVASGKKSSETFPTKTFAEHIWGYDPNLKIGLWKDLFGKDYYFLALRYAYTMPFRLRRAMARQAGMPENHKFAKYFGIGCIPTRHTKFRGKKESYPEFYFTPYSRDQYLKDIKKFSSRYREGYGH